MTYPPEDGAGPNSGPSTSQKIPHQTAEKKGSQQPTTTWDTERENLCLLAADVQFEEMMANRPRLRNPEQDKQDEEIKSWLESLRPSWATRETWLDQEAWGQVALEAAEAAAWKRVDELDKQRPRHQRYRGRTGSPEADWNRLPDTPVCWGCGGGGHRYSVCPTPRTGIFCYRCGSRGTTWRNCPNCAEGQGRKRDHDKPRREYRR